MGVMPYGALPILKAREQGKRPADMVLISMIGPLSGELNPVVVADQSVSYDWRWIRGLVACFWTTPKGYVAKHIIDASKSLPARLSLWDHANEKGYDISVLPAVDSIERPREKWELRIIAIRWTPRQERQFALGDLQWN